MDLMNPIGCNSNQLKDIMTFCGFEHLSLSDEKKLYYYSTNKKSLNKINLQKAKIIRKSLSGKSADIKLTFTDMNFSPFFECLFRGIY